MAQADKLNNTSSHWGSLAQTLVWVIQRIEMPPRDAEQIANSPAMNREIEEALNKLEIEIWRAARGMTEGMPIDKFRILYGGRYVDLLTLIQLPPGAEPGALSAAMQQFRKDIRWQDIECNLDWLKRAFPAPTADEDPTNPEPSLANRGGRPPEWDFAGVIPLLETRKVRNKPFKDMAAFKRYIQKTVPRVNGLDRGDGPEMTTVERAITKYCLNEYATFQK